MDCRHYHHIGYSGATCSNQKYAVWDDISGWKNAYANNVRKDATKCGPDALGWQNIVPSEDRAIYEVALVIASAALALLVGWLLR